MKTIFRKYDVRGIFGEELTENDAYLIGRGFCGLLTPVYNRVAVGYDGRFSSMALFKQLVKGITESGFNVIDIGLVPTPALYFSVEFLLLDRRVDGGIMITASHNPIEYNGFKMVDHEGVIFNERITKLAAICSDRNFIISSTSGKIIEEDIKASYIENLVKDIKEIKVNVAWDSGGGAAHSIIKELQRYLPQAKHVMVNDGIDPYFICRSPDPRAPNALNELQKQVVENKCNIGFAFDGDGDRIVVVSEKGELLSTNQLCLMLLDALEYLAGDTVVVDMKATLTIMEKIRSMGMNVVMCETGHAFIKEKMKETKAVLGLEMSSHIFFADKYFGFDDGIYAAMRVMQLVSEKNIKLSSYISALPQNILLKERRLVLDEAQLQLLLSNLKLIDCIKIECHKGVRLEFTDGWILVRKSNTENYVMILGEALNKEMADNLNGLIDEQLKKIPT